MKKLNYFYLSLALIVCAAFSMNAQNFISVDKGQAGQQISISQDQVLEVRLPMTPSNGYAWYLKNANNENVQELGALQQVGDWTFVSDHPEQPIGASGYQIIRYVGKASGSANLHFELIQPWTQEKAMDTYDIEAVSAGSYKGDYKAPEQAKLDDKVETYTASKSSALPAAFSWLDQGKLTVVKNQGQCGSCWAFAACGSFESVLKIKDGVTRDIAEQWLVNCTSGSSCSGGWCPDNMFKTYGAVYETDAKYTGKDGTCASSYTYHEKITGYKQIATNPTVDQIKQAIQTYGPVWIAVCVGSNFNAYKTGVLTKTDAGSVNHAVVLCGWDDANSCWILRNSWGTSWGENQGYMRIKYGTSQVGYNATYIQYGSVTGIDEDQAADQSASVYPNPIVDGKFTVNLSQFESNQPITITINDIQGKVVYKQEEKQNTKVEINAENFSKGMYFVNVSSQSKTANYKIVNQ
jgi:C1A family cysteine protease